MGISCLVLAINVAQLARGAWKKPPLYVVTAALGCIAAAYVWFLFRCSVARDAAQRGTALPRAAFLSGWTPFASGFFVRGLARIVVAERIGPSGFAYVARNACCPLAR